MIFIYVLIILGYAYSESKQTNDSMTTVCPNKCIKISNQLQPFSNG